MQHTKVSKAEKLKWFLVLVYSWYQIMQSTLMLKINFLRSHLVALLNDVKKITPTIEEL